ncbi:butyrophilin subfamily 1 member A1 isoform X1 [Chelonia mydas]|uniref:butyrophilin subfamily 1 member A1 isoform X1 n=1 Tax=Chelonia mydas TaxID=8469 RepID=UPI0018A22A58|nr:butyrophilin subfamily 1 member A1 isoform X1 [Chelonia mydas]XP_037769493.1 butyrophilin subfamily 1 member A1 isoform X1 [Chelonia mydas]
MFCGGAGRHLPEAHRMKSTQRCNQAIPVAFCLLLGIGMAAPESFHVLGPASPISAPLGGTVLLPCHLSPALSAQAMQVKWSRPQLGQDVHVYWPNRSEVQGTGYQGRTELITQGLAHGNVSLRIQDVQPSDEGQHLCEVQSPSHYSTALLELSVTGSGSDPVLHMAGYKDWGVWVLCLSAGWYPEPHVLWRNGRGETLSPRSEQKPCSDNGLFNVSSSLVVTESSDPALTCTIKAGFSSPERETTIRITGLFPRHAPEMWAFLIFLPICLFLVPLAVYLFRKLQVLKGEVSKEREWRQFLDKVSLSAAEVTLDQSTANPFLVLSADGRSVTCGILWQDVPKSDRRFDPLPCVLASQCFAARQHYWDVEVGEWGDWAIGAAQGSMESMGAFQLSPDVGVWALQCQEGEWSALTCPETPLQLESAPRMVRVHLDCEQASLAFYNAEGMAHIFTFTGCSREPLFPFFLLWTSGTQLTILPPGHRKTVEMDRTTRTVTPKMGKRQGSLIELLIMPGQS